MFKNRLFFGIGSVECAGKWCCFLSLLVLLTFLSGCQTSIPIRVNKDDLVKPTSPTNFTITMLSKAKDIRGQALDQVGRHTISALMIPGPTVTTESERLDEAVANRVKETLRSFGYTISTVDRLDQANGPVLVVQIDDLRNYLFSWLYPLGVTWGKMELSLHLMTSDANELWKANLEGGSGIMPSLLFMSGFETRVTSDLTSNMNQLVAALSSNEFRERLQNGQPVKR